MGIPSFGDGVELCIISGAIPPSWRGEEEIQRGNEETSPDDKDARLLNRFGPLVPHILGDLGDSIKEPVQGQTDLNHLGPAVVGRMLFRLAP
jgi:hypothetical protein